MHPLQVLKRLEFETKEKIVGVIVENGKVDVDTVETMATVAEKIGWDAVVMAKWVWRGKDMSAQKN